MVSRKSFAEQEFLGNVRQYLSTYAVARETDGEGRPGRNALFAGLAENAFYLFDAESACAVAHAIEDLALEEANGSVLAAFGGCKNFELHRERYVHLAATVDRVEVIVAGALPRRVPNVKFIRDTQGVCRDICVVSYEGRHRQAVLVCRQANRAQAFEDRQYEGFFSFEPRLNARLRRQVLDMAAGKAAVLREFFRLRAIDRATKQIKKAFTREREALDLAMEKLLLGGDRYQADHFASDLEKGLSRLQSWKKRLPALLARAEGR
jgi:hypothetical protein